MRRRLQGRQLRWRKPGQERVGCGCCVDAPELGLGLAVACVLCDGGGRDCGCESDRWPLGAPSEVAAQVYAPLEV
jgi:hypothetical protein